jgi:hypothetical protein
LEENKGKKLCQNWFLDKIRQRLHCVRFFLPLMPCPFFFAREHGRGNTLSLRIFRSVTGERMEKMARKRFSEYLLLMIFIFDVGSSGECDARCLEFPFYSL